MRVKDLLALWASTAEIKDPVMSVKLELPLELSAELLALKDMYPGRTLEQILYDLLTAAVNELKEKIPYKQGTKIIAEDEYGDPLYEDIGLTPDFLERTQFYRDKFRKGETIPVL